MDIPKLQLNQKYSKMKSKNQVSSSLVNLRQPKIMSESSSRNQHHPDPRVFVKGALAKSFNKRQLIEKDDVLYNLDLKEIDKKWSIRGNQNPAKETSDTAET